MGKPLKLAIVVIAIAGAVFYFREEIPLLRTRLAEIPAATDGSLFEEIARAVVAPEPIRARTDAANSFLTRPGVAAATNAERIELGLPPLAESDELNIAAAAKVEDMFARQYFAHVSPSGEDAADLAATAGYAFIMIGENLALGNFEGNRALVRAWMASPGHRANILDARYQEIGIAVGQGVFEGRRTWLAVQIFGLPRSACPEPDAELRATIGTNQAKIDALRQDLDSRRQDIERTRPKRGPEYRRKVEAYNAVAAGYNALIDQTRRLVEVYNGTVRQYNACAAGGG